MWGKGLCLRSIQGARLELLQGRSMRAMADLGPLPQASVWISMRPLFAGSPSVVFSRNCRPIALEGIPQSEGVPLREHHVLCNPRPPCLLLPMQGQALFVSTFVSSCVSWRWSELVVTTTPDSRGEEPGKMVLKMSERPARRGCWGLWC